MTNPTNTECWYAFAADAQTHYGFATQAEADTYLDALNRSGNRIYTRRMATPAEAAILDARGRNLTVVMGGR